MSRSRRHHIYRTPLVKCLRPSGQLFRFDRSDKLTCSSELGPHTKRNIRLNVYVVHFVRTHIPGRPEIDNEESSRVCGDHIHTMYLLSMLRRYTTFQRHRFQASCAGVHVINENEIFLFHLKLRLILACATAFGPCTVIAKKKQSTFIISHSRVHTHTHAHCSAA